MIDFIHDLWTVVKILNALAGGWLLPVLALLLAVIAVCAIWDLSIRHSRRRRPSVEELADPAYNPDLDHTERVVRDALGVEADLLAGLWEKREDSR